MRDIRTRVSARTLASRSGTGSGALMALLGDHAYTRGRMLLEMVLEDVVLHGGGHVESCRGGGSGVDREIKVSGCGRGEMVGTAESGGPLAGWELEVGV